MIVLSYIGGDRIKIVVRPGDDDIGEEAYLSITDVGRAVSGFLKSDTCPAIQDLDAEVGNGVVGVWYSNVRYFDMIRSAMKRYSGNVVVTNKLRRVVVEFRNKKIAIAAIRSGIVSKNFSSPDFDGELYSPFQDAGCWFLEIVERGLLADDMGLGKTIQALSTSSKMMVRGKIGRALILCPTSVMYQWAEEIQRFLPGYSLSIVDGNADERKESKGQTEVSNSRACPLFVTARFVEHSGARSRG